MAVKHLCGIHSHAEVDCLLLYGEVLRRSGSNIRDRGSMKIEIDDGMNTCCFK